MKNKYIKHAHISENKFRQVLRLFCADLTSTQIAEITKINRNTINRILQLLRARILKLTEEESYFEAGKIEIDDRISELKEFEANESEEPEARGKFLV